MTTKTRKECSFCGRSEREVRLLITGLNAFICEDCAQQAYRIVQENMPSLNGNSSATSGNQKQQNKVPKPKEIKAYLDEYVIGQDEA